ncbi:macro domain-containing protein [Trichormus azollae]|uniref:macro domain-containing protein n=1 Tax=Trichormus azollae TaxID=1164 RepID=UPI003B8384A5
MLPPTYLNQLSVLKLKQWLLLHPNQYFLGFLESRLLFENLQQFAFEYKVKFVLLQHQELIRDSSVQGQFLKLVYRGKQDKLDLDIETALQEHIGNRNLDPDKKLGKPWRYPIGTTITLGSYEKRYFLTGRKQKSRPNVAQTGSIRRKHVRIPVEPISK